MESHDKIFVAGHGGLVGSAIVRVLQAQGYTNLAVRTRGELDLLDQAAVNRFFAQEGPAYVFLAAAKVGGIMANKTYPADFIYENLAVQTNIIRAAHSGGVKKLLFLGSSCIYPRDAAQPIQESALLTGPLEPTNEAYAVAKIAGIKLCQAYNTQYGTDYISVMPTNLYGQGDNFDPLTSHVLPALIHKFHAAKESGAPEVVLWGTGAPLREFLHVDDLADAAVFLMNKYSGSDIINIGYGKDVTIRELAEAVKGVVGYVGTIKWDSSKPDGTPRKLLDSSKLRGMGWAPKISLQEGIASTYEWYKQHQN